MSARFYKKSISRNPQVRLPLRSHCPELGHVTTQLQGTVRILENKIIIISLDTLIHSFLRAGQETTLNRTRLTARKWEGLDVEQVSLSVCLKQSK